MSLTTEKVALWKRNAEVVKSYATDMEVKILQDRIIELADEVLARHEAPPTPAVPDEIDNNSQAKALLRELFGDYPVDSAAVAAGVWNACRSAMLGGAK